jgi:hypothetical protein
LNSMWGALLSHEDLTTPEKMKKEFEKFLQLLRRSMYRPVLCIENLNVFSRIEAKRFLFLLRDIAKTTPVLLSGGVTLSDPLPNEWSIDQDTELAEFRKSLKFDEIYLRRDQVSAPDNDTCRWILKHEDFLSWKRERSSILWIRGKPGSGKSVLAKSIFHRMAEDPSWEEKGPLPTGWFYSRRHGLATTNHTSMLHFILYQIFEQDRRSVIHALQMYRGKKPFSEGKPCSWTIEELENMLRRIATSGL